MASSSAGHPFTATGAGKRSGLMRDLVKAYALGHGAGHFGAVIAG